MSDDASFCAPVSAHLRLRTESIADLAVISAFLQDAIVPVCDMCYLREDRRFVMVASRFRWEREIHDEADEPMGDHERVLCALTFENVDTVRHRGFDRRAGGEFLNLLAIAAAESDNGVVARMTFAAGAAIRLGATHLSCHAADLGEPWPTPWRPNHV